MAEFRSLALKIILLIVTIRVSIAIFENIFAPELGLGHNHILVGETIVTIVISFVVIYTIRRVFKRSTSQIHSRFISSVSFFSILIISLIDVLLLLYMWNVQPQTILLGGGVTAIVVGIGLSTIVGNILSGALMHTTFPAKIGDSIFIVNDNIRGRIKDISMLYTQIDTEHGTEYYVPNSAIMQGNIRILKEGPLELQLPFVEGDKIELSNGSEKFSGNVIKITPTFTTILEDGKEIIVTNKSILEGSAIIIKKSVSSTGP